MLFRYYFVTKTLLIMRKFLYIIGGIFSVICTNVFFSCDDDKISTNPNHFLSFSQDTVFFDTVFTTIGSSTATFKVYNRNKEGLNIASLRLADAANSGFRVNVDGHHGTDFSDLEIRKQDSMYIFIEVNVNPQNQDNPILVKDSLVFQLSNGVRQDVKLLAYGQDVLILRGKVIAEDTVFNSWRPILIYDSLKVDEGKTLTMQKGTRLYFHDKIHCMVHGTLKAEGTFAEPVVFRGDRTDWMFSDLPYDRVAGQWGGVRFYGTSYDNTLNYVDIHGGQYAVRCDSSDVEKMKLKVENSVLHNVKGELLSATSSKIRVANSQLTNAEKNCVSLIGGDAEFIHCTIANFYTWGIRQGVAVSVRNINNEIEYPLINADFRNCLITGSGSDELSGAQAENKEIPFNYNFSYSLVNTILDEKADDYQEQLAHYPNSIWDDKKDEYKRSLARDKNFLYIGREDYIYDFRPDSVSAAVDLALRKDAELYPLDRQGRSRLSDSGPDAGCYEWMPGDKKGE